MRGYRKVPKLLENVDVAESEYVASIMAVNGYTTEFQPELEEKLNQLQVNVTSRLEPRCVVLSCRLSKL